MTQAYRYERKFMTTLTRPDAQCVLRHHPSMFRAIFQPRQVNNIYLDDAACSNYTENVDGAAQRRKIRVRWYGDLFGSIHKPVLEIKLREGYLGRKVSYALAGFEMTERAPGPLLRRVFTDSSLPDALRAELAVHEPQLVNSYSRSYALSADSRFRATLDSDLTYYSRGQLGNSLRHKHADRAHRIIELKYSAADDHDANRVSDHFPFRMTRSSKYVMGLDTVGAVS